jgi:dTDP-4-amino-4,6-dideoxygalactose transaminase
MTTGDGGMMVTNDPELFKDVKAMRWVGIDKDNWKTAQQYTADPTAMPCTGFTKSPCWGINTT